MAQKKELDRSSIENLLKQNEKRGLLRFSTAGSVDDGKSTLIGRLLHDSKNIFEDTLASVRQASSHGETSQELDLALLTDGLKAEREQKITIDVAYRYFSTPKRNFILADTPGHEQYTRNMATGATTADAAIILIDASKGVITQTKRHSFILSLVGVQHIIVAVNKMDLVDYSKEIFETIRDDYFAFATKLGISDLHMVPVSALQGDNVVERSTPMNWYGGEPILELLENLYVGGDRNLIDLRFPVQQVLRPDSQFRGYAGQVSSGVLRQGDEVLVLPSMRKSKIDRIVTFDGDLKEAFTPQSVVLTLQDEIDVSRGDMICPLNNVPRVENEFEAMVIWMSEAPLEPGKLYWIRQTTRSIKARVKTLRYSVDVNTLHRESASQLHLNEIARVTIQTNQALFFDPYERNRSTGSFVLVDPMTHQTLAAGMILDRQPQEQLRSTPDHTEEAVAQLRNIKVEKGEIDRNLREQQLAQKGLTIWLTGLSGSGKSTVAKSVEKSLFENDVKVIRLDGDNLRFGLNKDLGFSQRDRQENIRRVAEVAKLFNEAGFVVITAFISPYQRDREMARQIVGPSSFFEIFVEAPLEVCERRDPKGLYKKARSGEIDQFTGVSAPYEPPANADLILPTSEWAIEKCVNTVLEKVREKIR